MYRLVALSDIFTRRSSRRLAVAATVYRAAIGITGCCIGVASAYAQDASPNVLGLPPILTVESSETRVVSAAEARHHVTVKSGMLDAGYSFRAAHYPLDSLHQVVETQAAEWLMRLERSRVRGLQRDPAGEIGVIATHEPYAKQQIAERLATPNLSFADRAFTLVTAVGAFADRFHPERFPTAEAYLKELDALGDAALPWRFEARNILVTQCYRMGKSDDLIRYGVQALRLVPKMSYVEQWSDRMRYSPIDVYFKTVESLAGRPNARPLIDSLTTILEATIDPPASLLAQDSTWAALGRFRKRRWKDFRELIEMLGTTRPSIVGNYWVNRPTHDSANMSVSDGRIHVIVHGTTGCDGCLMGLYAMERIKQQFPDVQPVGLFSTFGFWGNRLVDSEVEAEHIDEYLTKQLKVTFPVAIWKGTKYQHEDGGYRADFEGAENQLNQAYPRTAKPAVYVVDGRGRLRRFFSGMSRETEEQLVQTLVFLEHEANAASGTGKATSAAQVSSPHAARGT